jgi:hypothetical protein
MVLARLLSALGGGLLVVACSGARGAVVQTPVDLAIAPIGGDRGAIATSGESGGPMCTLRLRASRIEKSSPGCYLDEHISHGPGLLRYPCGGEGPAKANFGGHLYVGHVTQGEVHVELSTELDWEDGCRWGTRAEISGTVASGGTPTQKRLSWQYIDRVIQGTNCSGICEAKSSFEVKAVEKDGKEERLREDPDDEVEADP